MLGLAVVFRRIRMKKYILVTLLLTAGSLVMGQKWQTKTAELRFEATESGFEPVRAKNSKVAVIIDPSTRKIAVLAKVRDFKFRTGLMQEHFNENYLESDRYPYMRFEGRFAGEESMFNFTGDLTVEGTLKLHGQSKKLQTKTSWSRSGDQLQVKVAFVTRPGDFGIKIPKIVIKKIAEEVEVEGVFRFDLSSK